MCVNVGEGRENVKVNLNAAFPAGPWLSPTIPPSPFN